MEERFEVTVRNRLGRVILRQRDATPGQVLDIEAKYSGDSRYSVVVAEVVRIEVE